MDVEENVEDFLERVKQLDLQRQNEDELRRRKLKDDIQSYKSREFDYNISIPNPIAREESNDAIPEYRSSIPNSDSLQNFNKSVSSQYRLDVDHLIYDSAYNYEKARKFNKNGNDENIEPSSFAKSQPSSHFRPDLDKDFDNLNSNFRASTGSFPSPTINSTFKASTGSISREKTYKKYDDIPNIIRFDDTLTKSTPNYKTSSRYSKFQLTDEQKKSLDNTIQGLVGNNHKITEVDDEPEENEENIPVKPKPLTRDRKGGIGSNSLSSALTTTQSNGWSNAAKQKPSLSPPATLSNSTTQQTSQLKRSPRKQELNTVSPSRPTNSETRSPIKKSPAKLDFSKFTNSSPSSSSPSMGTSNSKPVPPSKPLSLRDNNNGFIKKNSWLDSAAQKNSSTPQWQDTTSKIHINKDPKQASWLDSAAKKSTSTPQWQDTTSKIHINKDPKQASWLDSAAKKSTSTPQWQDTTSKIHINKDPKQASWLDSAAKKTTSTPQWQDTTPKIHLNNSEPKQASWLDSAMKNTPHKEFELPKSKIKPIVPSKSNTLAKMLEDNETSKEKQHMTLKELESRKLNHIETPKEKPIISPKKSSPEPSFSPQILKKTRTSSSSPIKKQLTNDKEPDFLKKKLSPAPTSSSSTSSSTDITAEALAHKSKLKPALPARKPSLEVPEALKKADKLKPPLPKRKPSLKIPEALAQKEQLRQAAQKEKIEEPTPEAVSQKNQLKPALPKRKPSVKEVEALEILNKMKSKNKGPPPSIDKPKPRVFSNSKEVLKNQLGNLKSTKELQDEKNDAKSLQKEQASLNLEKILKRAQTDTELKPVKLPFMTQEDEVPAKLSQKASTFDNADLESDKPKKELEHLTKKRTKGPKRRAPKKV